MIVGQRVLAQQEPAPATDRLTGASSQGDKLPTIMGFDAAPEAVGRRVF